MLIPLGLIAVPDAGTPVRIAATAAYLASAAANFQTCQGILVQAWHANTGRMYLGDATLVAASGVGVIGIVENPTPPTTPLLQIDNPANSVGVNIGDLCLDAETSNDGALVTLIVT